MSLSYSNPNVYPYGYVNNIIINGNRTNLHIGDQWSIVNKEQLIKNKISHILNMTPVEFHKFYEIIYYQVPLLDIPSQDILTYLDRTYDIIDNVISNGGNILIHCQAGISRSSSVLIAYIMRKYQVNYNTAYGIVKSARNIIEPNDGFKQQLLMYERYLASARA